MSLPYHPRQKQLLSLVQKLGIPETGPIKWPLLDLALTHSSFSPVANYEQLEFIGDAVVRLAVGQCLWETYPNCTVGELTAVRSLLVSDRNLAELANIYSFGRYLLVSESTQKDKLGEDTRLAEAFEAVLGVLYVSTNDLSLVRPWLDVHIKERAIVILQDPARQNYKAALQEWTQGHFKALPEYKTSDRGAVYGDIERYTSEVWFQGKLLGTGKGRSMKAAEQAAAQVAFSLLNNNSSESSE